MSENQPQSQPPSSPKPEANQSETTVTQSPQPPQKPSNQVQPVWKTPIIKVLRGTIGVLEGVVVKLEAQPTVGETRQPSFLNKLQLGWSAALAKIRPLLPENVNQKLSDTALTGIIAGLAAFLVWTTSALLPGTPPEVANVPPTIPPEVTVSPTTPPEVTVSPTAPPEVTVSPTAPPEVTVSPTAPPEVTVSPTTPPEVANVPPPPPIPTPPELTAPAEPQPIEVTPLPAPEATPSPALVLSPEQTLIAGIQNEVAEITNKYADGLIQSIQANFRGSRLTIKVSDEWYNLIQSQQDKLAGEMLERAKELDFSQLDITDTQATLLARSPVVGNNMIILKRQVSQSKVRSPESGVGSPELGVRSWESGVGSWESGV